MGSLDNLKTIALAVAALDEDIKQAQEEKRKLEAQLRPALEGKGPVQFEEYIFQIKLQQGRRSLDKALVEERVGDLTPFMKTGAPFNKMTITKVTKGEPAN